jgi:hypothetical protein
VRSLFPALALALLAMIAAAGWSAVSYDMYQTQQGDTPALVAARVGVMVADLCAWIKVGQNDLFEAGRSLIVYRGEPDPIPAGATEAQQQPQTAEKPQGKPIGRLGVVKVASVPIRSRRGGGRTFFVVKRGEQLCVRSEKDGYYGVLMIDGSTGWVPAPALDVQNVQLIIPTGSARGASRGSSRIIDDALHCLGTPYEYGGTFPRTTDCSGFVQAVFAHNNLRLPRTAATQFLVGYPVPPEAMTAGDRIYFQKDGRINHAGIYLGGGKFVHASSLRGQVAIDSLYTPFYGRRFAGARRP